MLSDIITEPLLDLDKCSLNELMTILNKIARDPSINVNQAGFGSYRVIRAFCIIIIETYMTSLYCYLH